MAQDLARSIDCAAMPSFAFEIEYAKSGRAACRKCKGKIENKAVRVGMLRCRGHRYAGGAAAHMCCMWHHVDCFPQSKGAKWFNTHLTPEVAETVTGLDALTAEDQETVQTLFKACRGECPAPAAPATQETHEKETTASKKRMRRRRLDKANG